MCDKRSYPPPGQITTVVPVFSDLLTGKKNNPGVSTFQILSFTILSATAFPLEFGFFPSGQMGINSWACKLKKDEKKRKIKSLILTILFHQIEEYQISFQVYNS